MEMLEATAVALAAAFTLWVFRNLLEVKMPGYKADADAIRKTAADRRRTRETLERQRQAILDKLRMQYIETGDRRFMDAIEQFGKDSSWLTRDDPLSRALLRYSDLETPIGDPGPIKMEEPPVTKSWLAKTYVRLFGGRKAGTSGVHGADDPGVLPEGGSAVSGGEADGLSASGESDAGGSGGG